MDAAVGLSVEPSFDIRTVEAELLSQEREGEEATHVDSAEVKMCHGHVASSANAYPDYAGHLNDANIDLLPRILPWILEIEAET